MFFSLGQWSKYRISNVIKVIVIVLDRLQEQEEKEIVTVIIEKLPFKSNVLLNKIINGRRIEEMNSAQAVAAITEEEGEIDICGLRSYAYVFYVYVCVRVLCMLILTNALKMSSFGQKHRF